MREIKFRAWDKSLNMMVYSKEQSGHVEYDTNPVDSINIMLNEDDYGLEFMEYTDLKDKNGKEIYEGDILDLSCEYDGDRKGTVEFLEGSFIVRNLKKRIDTATLKDILEVYENAEVSGNIYENPELLEV